MPADHDAPMHSALDAPVDDRRTRLAGKARSLPRAPGVYLMKDAAERVIYVGKARSLRDRVSSYFVPSADLGSPHKQPLLDFVEDFEFIECEGEWEALLIKADIGCVRADEALEGEFYADHPHAKVNALSVEVEHPSVGTYLRYGGLVEFSLTPGLYRTATQIGQHTRPLLREIGYDDQYIEALGKRRILLRLARSTASISPAEREASNATPPAPTPSGRRVPISPVKALMGWGPISRATQTTSFADRTIR